MATKPKKSAASAKPKAASSQASSSSNVMKYVIAAVVAVLVIGAAGYGIYYFANKNDAPADNAQASNAADTNTTDGTEGTDTSGLYTPEYKPNGKEVAVFDTSKGTIEVELNGKDAPIQVGNFVELAQDGYFDGTKFIRIEPIDPADASTTIVQFGSPESRDASKEEVVSAAQAGTGTYQAGNSGRLLKDELGDNVVTHFDGALAAANTGAANTSGSMFYFSLGAQPALDGRYTVFGKTTKGLDNEHKLEIGDTINSVTIKNANN